MYSLLTTKKRKKLPAHIHHSNVFFQIEMTHQLLYQRSPSVMPSVEKERWIYIFLFITWTNIINYFFNWRRNELSDRQGGQAKKILLVLRLLALLHFSNLSALFKKVPSITRNNEQFWTISFTRVRAIDLRFLDDLVFSLHRVNFKCKILYDYFL